MVGNTNAMTFKINPVVNLTVLMQRRKTQYIKVQLHNSNLPTDNPSSADDKNPVNQGSDTTIIVTFQMITPMKVMKAMVIQITTGQVLILFYTCSNSIKMKE